jgi:hypothetical protein
MKKQPKHCAHVAAYFANLSDLMRGAPTYRDLMPFDFLDGTSDPQGGKFAIMMMEQAFRYTRLAAREFVAAGGHP